MKEEILLKALIPLGNFKICGEQIKLNCPRCENELGMAADKYNLEVNTTKLAYKCWACGQHGSVYGLIHKYGYKEFANHFKTKKEDIIDSNISKEEIFELPPHLINAINIEEVVDYLVNERGLTKHQIKQRNIKFCFEGYYKGCIIFPSYDSTGRLNAFVSHDLITKKYRKKKAKHFTCFYESFIDKNSLIIITEGIYDALVVPNAIPLLGTEINESVLDFLAETNNLIIVDNDVNEKVLKQMVKTICSVSNKTYQHSINKKYKDLNLYHTSDKVNLKKEIEKYYE